VSCRSQQRDMQAKTLSVQPDGGRVATTFTATADAVECANRIMREIDSAGHRPDAYSADEFGEFL